MSIYISNLYAYVLERCEHVRNEQSQLGMIVPLSLVCSERISQLRDMYSKLPGAYWFSNFEIFPSRLFEGAFQRVTIMLSARQDKIEAFTTKLHRWYTQERQVLFDRILYSHGEIKIGRMLKLSSGIHTMVVGKLLKSKPVIPSRFKTDYFMFYQEAVNYWMKCCMRVPYYRKNGIVSAPDHGRFLFFDSRKKLETVFACLNSSLFYIWYISNSDGFHLNDSIVRDCRIPNSAWDDKMLNLLAKQLEINIKKNSFETTRNTSSAKISIESFRINLSKPIIDEIDELLAKHYGFTEEELDFIINYDIKYRMGDELNAGE